jgi:hypothetical protein
LRTLGIGAAEALREILLPALLPVAPAVAAMVAAQLVVGSAMSLVWLVLVTGLGLVLYAAGYVAFGAPRFERQLYYRLAATGFCLARGYLRRGACSTSFQ